MFGTFAVPLLRVHEFVLQRVGVRESQEQTRQQLTAPGESTLRKRMISKTSQKRDNVVLVLENLSTMLQYW